MAGPAEKIIWSPPFEDISDMHKDLPTELHSASVNTTTALPLPFLFHDETTRLVVGAL